MALLKRPSEQEFTLSNLQTKRARRAFTLVELLVVIAIIGILVGMLVPAMQNMRELSRRSACEQNLVQISLALSSYATQYGHFPAGSVNATGPIMSDTKGFHHNWLSDLLPMMDAKNVSAAIDRTVSVYDTANAPVRGLAVPMLRCPTASGVLDYTTCYAGITSSTETPIAENNDGVFRLNLPIRESDITDGLSYTIFVGEKISSPDEDLGWISGTRSSLRNAGHAINAELRRIRGPANPANKVGPAYVGGLASDHVGGAYVLMGSGEYQFRSSSMDRQLLAQLASRADGAIPLEWKVGTEVDGPAPSISSDTDRKDGVIVKETAETEEL